MRTLVNRALATVALVLVILPAAALAQGEEAPAKPESTPAGDEAPAKPGSTPAAAESPVARAVFTTEVVDHEPVDQLGAVPAGLAEISFFTEITGLEGELVTHRWMHDGEVVAEVPIRVRGPRWRAFSTKSLPDDPSGTWVVAVVDDEGTVLHRSELAPPSGSEAPGKGSTGESSGR